MKRIQKLVSMLEFLSINDMNKTLKRVADGDIVDGHYTIPDGVTKIGEYAFGGCKRLKSIIFQIVLLKLVGKRLRIAAV